MDIQSSDRLKSRSKADWGQLVCKGLRSQRLKHSFILNGKDIRDEHLGPIARAIHQINIKLEEEDIELSLVNNTICGFGLKHLARAQWKNLTDLDLSNNNIGDKGCKILVEGHWKYLKNLYLSHNKITKYGCFFLSKLTGDSLRYVYLHYNPIGSEGYKILRHCSWIVNYEKI